jgi:hypothetical protein
MRQTTTKHTPLHIIIKRRLSASESFLIPALPTTRVTPQGRNGTHPCMRIAGAAYPDTRGVTRLSVSLHRPIEPRGSRRGRAGRSFFLRSPGPSCPWYVIFFLPSWSTDREKGTAVGRKRREGAGAWIGGICRKMGILLQDN